MNPDRPTTECTARELHLTGAIDILILFAGQALTVRELRDRSGLPTPLFNQALDELESKGHVAWTDHDLIIHCPDPASTP